MVNKEVQGIAAAARAYFIAIGHMSPETDGKCKSWVVEPMPYIDNGDQPGSEYFGCNVRITLGIMFGCECVDLEPGTEEYEEEHGNCDSECGYVEEHFVVDAGTETMANMVERYLMWTSSEWTLVN